VARLDMGRIVGGRRRANAGRSLGTLYGATMSSTKWVLGALREANLHSLSGLDELLAVVLVAQLQGGSGTSRK
jgi:hypothetical protein